MTDLTNWYTSVAGIVAATIFLVAVLLWAIFGRLDIIAVADGRLVPDTYVKIVQPIDSGVVKEILVKEGRHAGDARAAGAECAVAQVRRRRDPHGRGRAWLQARQSGRARSRPPGRPPRTR